MASQIFEHPDRYFYVLIRSHVVKHIHQYRSSARESGGLLIGYRTEAGHIEIVRSTYPVDDDKSRRYSFLRIAKKHYQILKKCWFRTGGYSDYVGEWHTHPEKIPSPSQKDVDEWKRNRIESKRDSIIGVIVGLDQTRVWAVSDEGLTELIFVD